MYRPQGTSRQRRRRRLTSEGLGYPQTWSGGERSGPRLSQFIKIAILTTSMNRASCILALLVLPSLGMAQEKAAAPRPVPKSLPEPDFILRNKDCWVPWRATEREEQEAPLQSTEARP